MVNIVTEKRCTRCKKTKPLSEFYNSKKEKYGKTSWCKVCSLDHQREWRAKNNDKVRAQSKRAYYAHREDNIKRVMKWASENPEKHNKWIDDWHKAHREKGLKSAKKWRENNKDKERAKTRRWRKNNPEKARLQVETRRCRKIKAVGSIETKDWIKLCEKYDNRCLRCGKQDVTLSVDHIVPLSKGGSNTIDNVQPLCVSCNSRKHTKIIDYRPTNYCV